MTKEEFLQSIQNGKWFHISNGYQSFLVKMKPVTYPDIDTFIQSLWLSDDSWESMCFTSYDSESWDILDNQFNSYSADVYHFGTNDGPVEESVYTETGELNEEAMKKQILEHANKDYISPEELNEVWEKIRQKDFSDYETLNFK